jgi:hypothetical protein
MCVVIRDGERVACVFLRASKWPVADERQPVQTIDAKLHELNDEPGILFDTSFLIARHKEAVCG